MQLSCAVRYALCCTILYCSVSYRIVMCHYCIHVLYHSVLHCAILQCRVPYCIHVLCHTHCGSPFCIVLGHTALWSAIMHSCALLYSLCCTILYCTVPYWIVMCHTSLYCAILHCTMLSCIVLSYLALYCAILHPCALSSSLWCTILYCTESYCIVMCDTTLRFSALPFCIALCHAALWCAKLRSCAVSYCIVLYHCELHCAILLSCAVPYSLFCAIMYFTGTYYIVLYHSVLHWAILHYAVPYCTHVSAVASSIIGGGLIFIYSCSQTIKTIDFKRN
jgi:hypothetical protein